MAYGTSGRHTDVALRTAAALAVAPSPEALRDAARDILATGPYDLGTGLRLLLDAQRLWEPLRRVLQAVGRFLLALSPGAYYALLALLVAALAAVVALAVRAGCRAWRRRVRGPVDPHVTADPVRLEDEARRHAGTGDYARATRALFRATLVLLEHRRGGRVLKGLTNREYLRTFRTPWIVENLRVFVEVLDWKWYRARDFDAADYDRCRAAFEAIRAGLSQVRP